MTKKKKAVLFLVISSMIFTLGLWLQGWYVSKTRLLQDFCDSAGVSNCQIVGPVRVYENDDLYVIESETHYIPMIVTSWGPLSRFSIQQDHNLLQNIAVGGANLDVRWTEKSVPVDQAMQVRAYHGQGYGNRKYEVLVMHQTGTGHYGFAYENRHQSNGNEPNMDAYFETTHPMQTMGDYAIEIMPLIEQMYSRPYRIGEYDENQIIQKYYYAYSMDRTGTLSKAVNYVDDVILDYTEPNGLYLQIGPQIQNTNHGEVQVFESSLEAPVDTYPLLLELNLIGARINGRTLDQMSMRYYQYNDDEVVVRYTATAGTDAIYYDEYFVAPQLVYENMKQSLFVAR